MNFVMRSICFFAMLVALIVGKAGFIWAADMGSQIITSQTQQDINAQKGESIEDKIYQPQESGASSKDNQDKNAPVSPSSSNANQQKFLWWPTTNTWW